MLEKESGADPLVEDRDIKKPRSQTRNVFEEPVHRTSVATAELFSGIAEAFSKAFRSFGKELTSDSITRASMSNGFIAGMFAGNASFFEEVARTSQRVYEKLKRSDVEDWISRDEPINYELLARMMAEILKARVTAEAMEAEASTDILKNQEGTVRR